MHRQVSGTIHARSNAGKAIRRRVAPTRHPRPILEWLNQEMVASDVTERSAREQAQRRDQAELERLQKRLDVLYDDRLDGRIDASMYDQKAAEIREQQEQVRRRANPLRCRLRAKP